MRFIQTLTPETGGWVEAHMPGLHLSAETQNKIKDLLEFQGIFLDEDYEIVRFATPNERERFDRLMDLAVEGLERDWAGRDFKIVVVEPPYPNPFADSVNI